jgi:hypothetical protein
VPHWLLRSEEPSSVGPVSLLFYHKTNVNMPLLLIIYQELDNKLRGSAMRVQISC